MRRIFPYCYDVFLRSIKDRESIELKPFENTLEKNIEQALHTIFNENGHGRVIIYMYSITIFDMNSWAF